MSRPKFFCDRCLTEMPWGKRGCIKCHEDMDAGSGFWEMKDREHNDWCEFYVVEVTSGVEIARSAYHEVIEPLVREHNLIIKRLKISERR